MSQSEQRKAICARSREKNRERVRQQSRDYAQRNPVSRRESARGWIAANKEKRRAHRMVEYALSKGRIMREACERCGEAKTEAHHDDYSKPLQVRWLCRQCHVKAHQ